MFRRTYLLMKRVELVNKTKVLNSEGNLIKANPPNLVKQRLPILIIPSDRCLVEMVVILEHFTKIKRRKLIDHSSESIKIAKKKNTL